MARVRRMGPPSDEYAAWRRWLRAIGAMRERYFRSVGRDPLAISEAATVGLMLSAAGKAGLIGLLEYPTEKRTSKPKGWCYGRCDLWLLAPLHDDQDGWAFEVKHRRITPRSPKSLLVGTFRAAWKDAGKLDVREASIRLACTIFYSECEIAAESVAGGTIRRLARMSDWSWRISHEQDLQPVYVFVKRRRRGTTC